MSARVVVIDGEAQRLRLVEALRSIDNAIALLRPRTEIRGLERLRADVVAALALVTDAYGSSHDALDLAT
jgi:glycerol-3-phosphate cytidylyltransferase-like family protein